MKRSLDELQVDSYAHQVSESELTEIKGINTSATGFYLRGVFIAAGETLSVTATK